MNIVGLNIIFLFKIFSLFILVHIFGISIPKYRCNKFILKDYYFFYYKFVLVIHCIMLIYFYFLASNCTHIFPIYKCLNFFILFKHISNILLCYDYKCFIFFLGNTS
jgi:hypothetical protein